MNEDGKRIAKLSVEINEDLISQCKTIADLLYDDETKLNNVVEDAIRFYDASLKSKSYANFEEDIFYEKINSLLVNLSNVFAKNNQQILERVESHMLLASFDISLAECMLKEIYQTRDKNAVARYEDLKRYTVEKMQQQFSDSSAARILELQEDIQLINNKLEERSSEIESIKKAGVTLQKNYQNTLTSYNSLKQKYNALIHVINESIRLNQWHERRCKEAPIIQKKNSGLMRSQSWEDALSEFERSNPRPQVPSNPIGTSEEL